MNNRDRLIGMLVDHELERRDVAALLSVDLRTVEHWLRPPGSPSAEEPPTMAVELLEFKLAVNGNPATSNEDVSDAEPFSGDND